MTAAELLSYLTHTAFFTIFAVVLINAVRRPRRATINTALLFGALAAVFSLVRLWDWLGNDVPEVLRDAPAILILAVPVLLLRLADDFAGVPRVALRLAEVGLALVIVSLLLVTSPYGPLQVLLLVGYFVAVQSYATWRFVAGARVATGASRARMLAVAWGSGLFALVLALAGTRAVQAEPVGFWTSAISVTLLAAGIAYFVAFVTPRFLRRGWGAAQLERFLAATSTSPQRGDLEELTRTIERGVASTLGAPQAALLLWDPAHEALVWPARDDIDPTTLAQSTSLGSRVFQEQRALFVEDAQRRDPANAGAYRAFGVRSVLLAPISLGDRRFGVLTAFGEHPPLFAEDDLTLIEALASQSAVLLQNHALLDEMAEVRAREEAARLKDEFLSAAAHDLKTPLTTLVAQSQLMQRRARLQPEAPQNPVGIDRMVVEARRMRRLVDDLLDAARGEQGGFVGERVPVDLVALARELAMSLESPRHRIEVVGRTVEVSVDRNRIAQVLSNLLENAIKFSPAGGDVRIEVSSHDTHACLIVRDQGMGIPEADRGIIFERFQRGSQARDRGTTGLGLGLYLCKRIVEEHGGRISVASTSPSGSTFQVELPLEPEQTTTQGGSK